MPEQEKKAKKGFTRLTAPEDATGLSVDGIEYVVEKGVVEVSNAHLARAIEHGFAAIGGDE